MSGESSAAWTLEYGHNVAVVGLFTPLPLSSTASRRELFTFSPNYPWHSTGKTPAHTCFPFAPSHEKKPGLCQGLSSFSSPRLHFKILPPSPCQVVSSDMSCGPTTATCALPFCGPESTRTTFQEPGTSKSAWPWRHDPSGRGRLSSSFPVSSCDLIWFYSAMKSFPLVCYILPPERDLQWKAVIVNAAAAGCSAELTETHVASSSASSSNAASLQGPRSNTQSCQGGSLREGWR